MIADTISASNELVSKTDAELRELEHLKRGLMQDLLTGKVRVHPRRWVRFGKMVGRMGREKGILRP